MGIDGVGGPKGPGGPKPPDAIEPSDGVESTEAVAETFSVADLERTEAAAPALDPTIDQALESVSADLRSGQIPTLEAGLEAVVERVVEARYAEVLTVRERQLFAAQLRGLLADDPVMGAHIRRILSEATEGG